MLGGWLTILSMVVMVFIDGETPAAVMDKGAKDRFGSEVHHVACVRHTALERFDV